MRLASLVLLAAACSSTAGGGGGADGGACVGRGCEVPSCGAGATTTLVGTVFAPNGTDPVPNATVYIPAKDPIAFPEGVACDLCGTVPGAVAQTTTSYDGGFRLTGVPAGDKVPVVVELGRFRRVVTAKVEACKQNIAPRDPNVFGLRLPRKDMELSPADHVPRIAVATGDFDQIECVLKRMGLEQLDLYSGRDPGTLPAGTLGPLDGLLTDEAKLRQYNILVVNCTKNQYQATLAKPGVLRTIERFVGAGGRLYATDWAYDVIHQVPEFAPYMCFVPGGARGPAPPPSCAGAPGAPGEAQTTIPYNTSARIEDQTMRRWLEIFPNTIFNGLVPVEYNFVVVNRVVNDAAHPGLVWADGTVEAEGGLPLESKGIRPLTATFDYQGCGRVHFSTYNTEPSAVVDDTPMGRYPSCGARAAFNPQERLLEYLLFEVAQCVGPIG